MRRGKKANLTSRHLATRWCHTQDNNIFFYSFDNEKRERKKSFVSIKSDCVDLCIVGVALGSIIVLGQSALLMHEGRCAHEALFHSNFQSLFNLIRFPFDFFYYFLIWTSSSTEMYFFAKCYHRRISEMKVGFLPLLCYLFRTDSDRNKEEKQNSYNRLADYRGRDSACMRGWNVETMRRSK